MTERKEKDDEPVVDPKTKKYWEDLANGIKNNPRLTDALINATTTGEQRLIGDILRQDSRERRRASKKKKTVQTKPSARKKR